MTRNIVLVGSLAAALALSVPAWGQEKAQGVIEPDLVSKLKVAFRAQLDGWEQSLEISDPPMRVDASEVRNLLGECDPEFVERAVRGFVDGCALTAEEDSGEHGHVVVYVFRNRSQESSASLLSSLRWVQLNLGELAEPGERVETKDTDVELEGADAGVQLHTTMDHASYGHLELNSLYARRGEYVLTVRAPLPIQPAQLRGLAQALLGVLGEWETQAR